MTYLETPALATQLGMLQQRLAALTEENDLLLSQLNRLIDEPRLAVLDGETGPFDVDVSDSGLMRVLARLWTEHQPAQWHLDLRQPVCGSNWYHAEHDGRWAGPLTQSSIRMPSLASGDYQFCFEVVDAMNAEQLALAQVNVDGKAVPVELQFTGEFPAQLRFQLHVEHLSLSGPVVELVFPFVRSPSERGVPDDRLLAIRVKALQIERIG